ncbi:MAG: hypothetical protein HC906_18635 [Bacteroidales bacterium]|nr:hypothetical protein [Bacteroidales bacterium]
MISNLSFCQDCSPLFKEIFDFRIGDYFNYITNYNTADAGYTTTQELSEWYIITSSIQKNDTLGYVRMGFASDFRTYESYFLNERDTSLNVYFIHDTVIYVDSVNHFLNQCKDSVVDVYIPNTLCCCQDEYYPAKIQIELGDHMKIKKIENKSNCCSQFEIIHAKGLGLVRYTCSASNAHYDKN